MRQTDENSGKLNCIRVGFEIELLGFVTDSECNILVSLSVTKPNGSISRPTYEMTRDTFRPTFKVGHHAIRVAFWAPQVRREFLGSGGRTDETGGLPSFLPSALLTFIFVCLMHADLKEGIGKDSLPKTKQNTQTKKNIAVVARKVIVLCTDRLPTMPPRSTKRDGGGGNLSSTPTTPLHLRR